MKDGCTSHILYLYLFHRQISLTGGVLLDEPDVADAVVRPGVPGGYPVRQLGQAGGERGEELPLAAAYRGRGEQESGGPQEAGLHRPAGRRQEPVDEGLVFNVRSATHVLL